MMLNSQEYRLSSKTEKRAFILNLKKQLISQGFKIKAVRRGTGSLIGDIMVYMNMERTIEDMDNVRAWIKENTLLNRVIVC